MGKKVSKKTSSKRAVKKDQKDPKQESPEELRERLVKDQQKRLPPEVQKKIEEHQKELEGFRDDLLGKFEHYIVGVGLLPPPKLDPLRVAEDYSYHHNVPLDSISSDQRQKLFDEAVKKVSGEVHILVLIDDSDSQKMSKQELKDKLSAIIREMAKKRDERFVPSIVILSELWQSCYDQKYDLLQLVSIAAPIFDKGMMAACRIGEVHKSMVLKKFEKYIVSYILFGSLTRGEARPDSDIDVAIIIDDTDVKKMTRAELKDKLRAIIIGMGIEAGELTGIKSKLNIQTYILTDFWDSVKEANPVIFTVLRDGVPFYDRGMFMPWKQLLRMGKIKPSQEAIDMFMSSGEQMVTRVKRRIRELVEADIYWATLTPAQAALMLYGLPPPTPKETLRLLDEVFVKKEKMLEKKYVDILKKIRKYYKDLEHGNIKSITGKEVDDLLSSSEDYLKRIRELFGEIEAMKEREDMLNGYETVVTVLRDTLALLGEKKVPEKDLLKEAKEVLFDTGKVPERYQRMLKELFEAKKHYDKDTLKKTEVDKARKTARELTRTLVEFLQRERGKEMEKARIRVKVGEKYGEVVLMQDIAFVIPDLDQKDREFQKAVVNKDGSLGEIKASSIEEYEEHLAKAKFPKSVFIKEPLFEDLKRIFGKHVEILVQR